VRCKITIVGTGALAEATAAQIGECQFADVVVTVADGKWEDAAGSDVVVLAEGDAAATARRAAERCPDAVLVVAADPVEAGCRDVLAAAAPPRGRVVGVAGAVEAPRLGRLVASALGVSARDVSALVLGGRGRAAVPVLSALRVAGLPVTDKLAAEGVARVVAEVRDGPPADARAVARAVAEVVEAIALDLRRVVPCAVLCQGELGIEGAVAGVPVVLGEGGVQRVFDVVLDAAEREALSASAVLSRSRRAT
jgi:malate dehydrogenase